MQHKTLASLLFATAALAVSAPEAPTETGNVEFPLATAVPPNSIISALVTAIPQSWALQWGTDTAFQSSVISDYLHGTYPAWASSLSADVVSWASSEGVTGLAPLATTTASTAGAPAATGGIVLSLVGAAGVLGLAIAL